MLDIKKICVITGSRAEYGLLRKLIKILDVSELFQLQLIVTGSHLSKKFGETINEVEGDGFKINSKIDINLVSDTPIGISKSTSIGLSGFADEFELLNPDMISFWEIGLKFCQQLLLLCLQEYQSPTYMEESSQKEQLMMQ